MSIPVSAKMLAAAFGLIPQHRARQRYLLLVGLQSHGDFFIQVLDHLFDASHMPKRLSDQEAVMVAHSMTFQRFHNLRNLWRQAPVPEFDEPPPPASCSPVQSECKLPKTFSLYRFPHISRLWLPAFRRETETLVFILSRGLESTNRRFRSTSARPLS